MQIKKNFYHIFLFPIILIYFEILLRIFSRTGVFSHLIYPILFGLGTGLLFSCITSVFSFKTNRILSLILLFVSGLIFTLECLVQRSMQYYMPPDSVRSAAGGVAEDYMQQVIQTVFFSLPIIFFFFLPAVLYLIWGNRFVPACRQIPIVSLCLLAGSILFTGIGVLASSSGASAPKYTSQYKFDTATQYFGLISSLQLDAAYGLFGNKAADTLIITANSDNAAVDSKEASNSTGNLAGDSGESSDSDGNGASDTVSNHPSVTNTMSASDNNVSNSDNSAENAAEKVYAKNEMELPLDEISASASDEALISMNEYVKSIPSSSQNEYTGLFKGKNLILICAEAFSDAAISEELTPTLYRLAHKGFYFSDFYQPNWGGSTSTGEYSMLMGIAPLLDIRTMPATEGKNLYFTMGNQLHRLGYAGNAYHNGGYEYYSRHLTHQNLGYDEYIALGNGLEDLTQWWPTDGQMFDATLPTYIDNQPFSVYYMTGSAHFPYEADNAKTTKNLSYVSSLVGDQYKDKTLYYLCYQMELEYALASMVQQLESAGIADDTVICITSDHYPYGLEHSSTFGNSEDYIEDLYGYYPQNDWEQDRNAWILWSGCLENEYKDMACEISDPTYSLDILPTLSNLFGLEYDSRLLVGRDVFSDTKPLVLWTNHSWVTVEGKYDSATGTFYPNEGSAVDAEYVEQMKNIVSNKISFSRKILNYDYYNILLGNN